MNDTRPWYAVHANLSALVRWLADARGWYGTEIADAVEKPWAFEDEYLAALASLEHESSTGHQIAADEEPPERVHCYDCDWEHSRITDLPLPGEGF